LVVWPLAAGAQQAAVPVIGFLGGGSLETDGNLVAGFRQGLSEFGYIEGRNVSIEYRWAENKNDRLPALVSDLIRRQVNVIIGGNTPGVVAAKAATATIPIVFLTASDPVATGFAASLNRPGGNLTGVTFLGVEIGRKQFELLREVVPTASTIAFLLNPTNRTLAEPLTRDAQAATAVSG
jgi:putative tryptophan/tyrosine transport system substrate-binding protein